MSKIKLEDTTHEIIFKMSEGNPGAVRVLCEILQNPQIDPDGFMGPTGVILSLDILELYGSNIWILYKDVCGESVVKFIAVTRAYQLGFATEKAIHQALNDPEILDVDSLCAQVEERLPNFNKEERKA